MSDIADNVSKSSNISNKAVYNEALNRKRILTANENNGYWIKCAFCKKYEACMCDVTFGVEPEFKILKPYKNIFFSEYLNSIGKKTLNIPVKKNSSINLHVSHNENTGIEITLEENKKQMDTGISSLESFKNFKAKSINIEEHLKRYNSFIPNSNCDYIGFEKKNLKNNIEGYDLVNKIEKGLLISRIWRTEKAKIITNNYYNAFLKNLDKFDIIKKIKDFIDCENNSEQNFAVNRIDIDFTIQNYTLIRALDMNAQLVNNLSDFIVSKKELENSIDKKLLFCEENFKTITNSLKSISSIFINNSSTMIETIKNTLWSNKKYPDFNKIGIQTHTDENLQTISETQEGTQNEDLSNSNCNLQSKNCDFDNQIKSAIVSILLSIYFIENVIKETNDLLDWIKTRFSIHQNYILHPSDFYNDLIKNEYNLFLDDKYFEKANLIYKNLETIKIYELVENLSPKFIDFFNHEAGFTINFLRISNSKRASNRYLKKEMTLTINNNQVNIGANGIKKGVFDTISDINNASFEAIEQAVDWAKKSGNVKKLNTIILLDTVDSKQKNQLMKKLNGIEEKEINQDNYITIKWENMTFDFNFAFKILPSSLCCTNHSWLFSELLTYNNKNQSIGYNLNRKSEEIIKDERFKLEFTRRESCTMKLDENTSRHLSSIIRYVDWTMKKKSKGKLHKIDPGNDFTLIHGYWLLFPREAKADHKVNKPKTIYQI